MNFWVKRVIIAVIIAGLAFAAIDNIDVLMSLDEKLLSDDTSEVVNDDATVKTTDIVEPDVNTPIKKKPKPKIKHKNAAAEGLSRFYASLNPDDTKGPKIVNGTVFLPDPVGDLEKIMRARRQVTRALPKKWNGTRKNRPFRKGETLYQKLTQYAQEDGLQVIWRLNKDLVVKVPFRINKNILQIANKIGQSLNGHFPGGVSTYFCYKHRALVLMEYHNKYLDKECTLLNKRYAP